MMMFYEPWLQFKHPIVRQLAFVIASPNIIQKIPSELTIQHSFELHDDLFWQMQFEQYYPRLLILDQNSDELLIFLQQLKSTRLGLRFEHLMWFWLKDNTYHSFQLIGHSIQIIEGKNTIGEVDFLILNKKTNKVEHWEVALKFYLAELDLILPNWYGLNRSDTLLRKLNHFTTKQFQFTQVLDQNIEQRFMILKGQLYVPLPFKKGFKAFENLPNWVNPRRRLGDWGNDCLTDYYRIGRQEWICPNLQQSSPNAYWWCDGLYRNKKTQHAYMFRLINISPLC